MCAARVFVLRAPSDFARTSTFGWALGIAGAFVLSTLLLFGFVYWQTAAYMTATVDDLIFAELNILTTDTPDRRLGRRD